MSNHVAFRGGKPGLAGAVLPRVGDGLASPRGILILDETGVIRYCDGEAVKILGVREEALLGRPVRSLIPALALPPASSHFARSVFSRSRPWRRFHAVAPSGEGFEVDAIVDSFNLRKTHQFLLIVCLPGQRFRPQPGRCSGAVPHSGDGHLERLEQVLDRREEMALIADRQGIIRYVNDAFVRVTGYERGELLGQTPHVLFSGVHDRAFYEELWRTLEQGGTFSALITNRKKSGELYHQETSIRPFLEAGGRVSYFVLTAQDISQRVHAMNRLQHLAHHDYLTGLPNRALFCDRLGQARARAGREGGVFALLYLDLDRFKEVNDLAGHAAGDDLLRELATHLCRSVREEDTVARLGGDEFACILSGIPGRQEAMKVSRKMLAAVREASLPAAAKGVEVTASIGLALYPEDGDSETVLLEVADRAMYRAKAEGGDTVCFWKEESSPEQGADECVPRRESCQWR